MKVCGDFTYATTTDFELGFGLAGVQEHPQTLYVVWRALSSPWLLLPRTTEIFA